MNWTGLFCRRLGELEEVPRSITDRKIVGELAMSAFHMRWTHDSDWWSDYEASAAAYSRQAMSAGSWEPPSEKVRVQEAYADDARRCVLLQRPLSETGLARPLSDCWVVTLGDAYVATLVSESLSMDDFMATEWGEREIARLMASDRPYDPIHVALYLTDFGARETRLPHGVAERARAASTEGATLDLRMEALLALGRSTPRHELPAARRRAHDLVSALACKERTTYHELGLGAMLCEVFGL